MDDALSYCTDLVREKAYDSYFLGLFLSQHLRARYFAVHAFNLELAQIRSTVSEPALAAIRYQWWREALQDIKNGKIRAHPVLHQLSRHIHAQKDAKALEPLIEARETEFSMTGEDLKHQLTEYADTLGSSLWQSALGAVPDMNAEICGQWGAVHIRLSLLASIKYELEAARQNEDAWFSRALKALVDKISVLPQPNIAILRVLKSYVQLQTQNLQHTGRLKDFRRAPMLQLRLFISSLIG